MVREYTWTELETRVRTLASCIWNAPARAEELYGVRFDAVLKPDPDRWIIIEATTSNTLQKLREDLAKFAPVRHRLISDGIHVTCYFVTPHEPSPSILTTAKGVRVSALSIAQLEKTFFDYEQYRFIRSSKPFGSAVDLFSGEKDELPYVPVLYSELGRNRTYSLHDLVAELCNQKKIILLGNYGTGKSRCIQELFSSIARMAPERHIYPLAIDLREHWGLRRRTEIVRRHFDDLGFGNGADPTLRIMDTGAVTLLLDGFDEIASQVWSDDPKQLEEIRVQSLMGVADLLRFNRGGVLVAGREHYFNTEDEMFRCLGLDREKTLVVSCADEFSDDQMAEFLNVVRKNMAIPNWLPRRPLVSKMLAGFDVASLDALSDNRGETDFWQTMLDTICKRESRIHPSLDTSNIRSILLQLSDLTRTKMGNVGPISLTELNDTFESVVGRPPRDEASAMLQRLPVLGRIDASSSDRQFLDTYILDGLRATSVAEMPIVGTQDRVVHEKWRHHLGPFGQSVLTQHLADGGNSKAYVPFLKKLSNSSNRVLAGDLITALLGIQGLTIDFGHLVLSDSHLGALNLADNDSKRFRITNSFIDELSVDGKSLSAVSIENV